MRPGAAARRSGVAERDRRSRRSRRTCGSAATASGSLLAARRRPLRVALRERRRRRRPPPARRLDRPAPHDARDLDPGPRLASGGGGSAGGAELAVWLELGGEVPARGRTAALESRRPGLNAGSSGPPASRHARGARIRTTHTPTPTQPKCTIGRSRHQPAERIRTKRRPPRPRSRGRRRRVVGAEDRRAGDEQARTGRRHRRRRRRVDAAVDLDQRTRARARAGARPSRARPR